MMSMEHVMYSKIFLCISETEDEVLTKQLAMLSERHHADVERIDAAMAADIIADCGPDTLFISDDDNLLLEAKDKGMATNTPAKMRESYKKAMEMLKALGTKKDFTL